MEFRPIAARSGQEVYWPAPAERSRIPGPIPVVAFAVAIALLIVLAIVRAPDHDESQYVASAVLAAQGLLPYRDFAYLQTPLQPLLFAPVAALSGTDAWLALRIVNALLGGVILIATYLAARTAGGGRTASLAAAGLLAACDAFLFSVGTARNDALPAALLAIAVVLLVREGATRSRAAGIGLLLAAAVAAKISYALPAAAVGFWAVRERGQYPLSMMVGALPIVTLCIAIFAMAPAAAWFEVIRFPTLAPSEYYAATERAWKLGLGTKLFDLAKFLLLGPAAIGLWIVIGARRRAPRVLLVLMAAGLAAAALPTPSWRQYLLPALPPLFVLLAWHWTRQPPAQWMRRAVLAFVLIGIAPTTAGLAAAVSSHNQLATASAAARAVGAALDDGGYAGPVTTLSPQFLPTIGRLPDVRFATGPFYFRSRGLLSPSQERAASLLGHRRLGQVAFADIVLVGGEDGWTSGDRRLDAVLETAAIGAGYQRLPGAFGRFRVYVRQRAEGHAGGFAGRGMRP